MMKLFVQILLILNMISCVDTEPKDVNRGYLDYFPLEDNQLRIFEKTLFDLTIDDPDSNIVSVDTLELLMVRTDSLHNNSIIFEYSYYRGFIDYIFLTNDTIYSMICGNGGDNPCPKAIWTKDIENGDVFNHILYKAGLLNTKTAKDSVISLNNSIILDSFQSDDCITIFRSYHDIITIVEEELTYCKDIGLVFIKGHSGPVWSTEYAYEYELLEYEN